MTGIAENYAKRIWDDKDLSAIDEWIDPECLIHSLLGNFRGPEPMKKVVGTWLNAFPDLSVKNIQIISENDLTVIHWEAKGTHQGEFKGLKSTGKPVSYAGVTIYRTHQDKIIEYWAYLDMQHLLKQISL